MNKIFNLLPLTMAIFLISCASPTIQQLPTKEAGKGVVVAYSSTLNMTSSLNLFIDDNSVGDITGDKVKVVYLSPGEYNVRVMPHNINVAANTTVNVKAGEYYFLNAFTTTAGARKSTTYHLDAVNQAVAMNYLQGPTKFTGWGDLVSNSINGKRIW